MRRSYLSFALLLAPLAACGSDESPTIDAGGLETGSTAAPTTSGSPETTTPPTVGGQSLSLTLTGDAEVPGPGSDGTGTATLDYDGSELCATVVVDGTGPITAGHVHAAPAGEAGPVVIDLLLEGDGELPRSCVEIGAEGGVIFEDPTSYYLNLHTAELPDGAVRAQLG